MLLRAPLDLADPPAGFFDDPYPAYRAVRETAALCDDGRGGLLVSRHADLSAIYRDAAAFLSDKRQDFAPKFGAGPLFEHHTTSLVFNDDPYHGRVRRRLTGALSPRAVAALGERLARHCDALIDALLDRGGGDLVELYASAVPVRVIGDMLGVPEADRAHLRHWSLAILGALEPVLGVDQRQAGNDAVTAFAAYLEALIADRRRYPGDPEQDLLTRLIAADDPPLTVAELVHNAIFLLNAGHEMTSNLIGSALHILGTRPDEVPDSDAAIDGFVEEVLRFESPNQLGNRRAGRDCTIAGIAIAAGTPITLMIGAANRDPAVFPDPDRFDPHRRPNRHLAFGAGSHQCAGLSLARVEARVAIARIRQRRVALALCEEPRRQHRVRFRGFEALHMTVTQGRTP